MNLTALPPELDTMNQHELLLDLVNHLDELIAYWDADQTCVFANSAYRTWFGRDGKDLAGIKMKDLLGHLYPMNLPFITAAYGGQKQVFERTMQTPSGETRHGLVTYHPHFIDGKVHGMYVHVANVTPMKQLEQELEKALKNANELAAHDHLTGQLNRILLNDIIQKALAQAKRRLNSFAVMTIDFDAFKLVNDTYGHAEGDRYLVEISTRIRNSIREGDTLLRVGGDEFIVVAINTKSEADVEAIAKGILDAARCPFYLGAAVVAPSLSIGIATYPKDGSSTESLCKASDSALYRAKRSGGDCFSFEFVA